MLPKTKAEALALGLKRYFTGMPCVQGHLSERNLKGNCVVCGRLATKAWALANKAHRQQALAAWHMQNKSAVSARKKADREKDPEKYRARRRKWSEENPEKVLANQRAWRSENLERHKAVRKSWEVKNSVSILQKRLEKSAEANKNSSAWYFANKGRRIAAALLWRSANVERTRVYSHNRRQRLIGELSPGLVRALMTEQAGRCACPCRRDITGRYHMDHIVSVARGGLNVDANIQLLTPECNQRKATKDNKVFMEQQARKYAL